MANVMMKENMNVISKYFTAGLDLQREPVGVRFLVDRQAYDKCKLTPSKSKLRYCQMVQNASLGERLKVSLDNFACFAGARVLGLVEIEEWYRSGSYYNSCGLYQDRAIAKNVTKNIEKCDHKVLGMEIQPLGQFEEEPDVVILIGNAFQMMRLVQAYAYKFGFEHSFKSLGNQAMCSECTASPYMKNGINLSMLCAGTRESGFADDELALGIVYNQLHSLLDGLCSTVTPVESNMRKKKILEKSKELGVEIDLEFNKDYGTPLFKHDCQHFLKKR